MALYRINIGLSFPHGSSPGVNTFHARDDVIDDVQDVVGILQTFYTSIRQFYGASTTISCPNEVIRDPYGDPSYQTVTGWSVVGSGTGNYLPPANQVCVSWRSSSATRSGRGRTFLGPLVSQAQESDGSLSAVALTQFRTAASTLVSNSEGLDGAALVVYSRRDGVARDITSAFVRDQFAVLRSRR